MSEIENFEGDLFWNADDTESTAAQLRKNGEEIIVLDDLIRGHAGALHTCDGPYDELLYAGEGNIVVFEQAKRLPNFYGALINGEERYFESLGEVEEALKEAKNGRV